MKLATAIAFLVGCFMFFAIVVRIFHLLWDAMVVGGDRMDYGRNFWDDDKEEEEITADIKELLD